MVSVYDALLDDLKVHRRRSQALAHSFWAMSHGASLVLFHFPLKQLRTVFWKVFGRWKSPESLPLHVAATILDGRSLSVHSRTDEQAIRSNQLAAPVVLQLN